MIDYKVIIASKGRADRVTTIDLFLRHKNIYIFVDTKEEAKAYKHLNETVNVISSGCNGVAATMNYAMKYFPKGTNLIFACDDVLNMVYKDYVRSQSVTPLTPREIENFIERAFQMTKDEGAKMWGVNPTNSGAIMLKDRLTFYNFVIGTIWGCINTHMELDLKIKRKHDYEFTARQLHKYGKILRFDCFRTTCDFANKKGGGCEGTFADKLGKQACEYIINKYPQNFKPHHRRENELHFHFSPPKGSKRYYEINPTVLRSKS